MNKKLSAILLAIPILLMGCSKEDNFMEKLGYTKDDIVVIVNADDYGCSIPHTDATVELLDKTDFVKTATIMATNPDFERAAKIAVEKGYSIGVHITLTNEWQEKAPWGAVLPKEEVPSLYNEKGYLWATQDEVVENANIEDIEKEMEAQIQKIKQAGINITHMDAHMYIYYPWFAEDYFKLAKKIAKKHGIHLSVRFMDQKHDNLWHRENGNLVVDNYYAIYDLKATGGWGDYEQRRDRYVELFSRLQPGIYHLTIHPALDTEESKAVYPQWKARYSDYKIWFSDELKAVIKERNIKFTDYSQFNQLEKEFHDQQAKSATQ
ncbi:ChbG/HpnK family deacetylase [Vibrio sonorensis]|uniref:ChbG/HpnK family deacetylase n=1 Tax=Vibrio sonorensis TaxID=1004316 RepID=UPI0008D90B6D|nr:ChbG/HpnK family deacetylase [Vibrio sonorensis]